MAEPDIRSRETVFPHTSKGPAVSLDIVVTVCDDASENCPYIPARVGRAGRLVDETFDEPLSIPNGSDV